MSRSKVANDIAALAGLAFRRRKRDVALPRYGFPTLPSIGFGMALVLGRRRSFVRDSQIVAAFNDYPRRIEQIENVPQAGSFLLAANHYARSGLQPYHWAMIITSALAERRATEPHIYWVFTSEWRGRHFGPIPIPAIFFRWLFSRVAFVHDLVTLPTTPNSTMKRAATMRKLFHLARRGPIGITPEGTGPGVLQPPPPGSGLLLHALNRSGLPVLPLAVWEEGDELVYRFGVPFDLNIPTDIAREDQDNLAQEQVMTAIGQLLPEAYRGVYTATIAATGGGGK